jgi:hypothetical protein
MNSHRLAGRFDFCIRSISSSTTASFFDTSRIGAHREDCTSNDKFDDDNGSLARSTCKV